MSADINAVLSRITPEMAAFLVEAWLAYQGIPDVSTLKFIGALMDLEFEIVRYWFYSRSNRDGIMRAFAQSAARGSRAGIVLPVLEDYHLLDKFSEDIEWDYRGPEQGVQELEQEQEELTSISSTPATQRPQRTLSQQKRQSSDTKQPSDTSKAQTIDNRNTENLRVKATRRQSKNTRESADEFELASNDESEHEETATLGSRRVSCSLASGGPSKTSRSLKRVIQRDNDEPPKKRGRPLGSFSKKKEAKISPRTRTKHQKHPPTTSPPSTEHSQSTDSPRTNTPTRYPTPIVLIPRLNSKARAIAERTEDKPPTPTESALSIFLLESTTNDNPLAGHEVDHGHISSSQSTEPTAPASGAPTLGLVGNPVAGAESRKRFLEQQQSVEERERRARIRALSKAPTKARGNGIATRAISKRRRAIHLSEEEDLRDDHDDKDDNAKDDNTKDDNAKDEVDGGSAAHLPRLNNSVNSEVKKADKAKGPPGTPLGTHSFYKEFALIKPKRREKQPAKEQPPDTTIGFEIPPTLIPGEAPHQVQLTMNRAITHVLPINPMTPTLPSQAQFGVPGVPDPHSHPDGDSAIQLDPAVLLEQDRLASQQRDQERRMNEADNYYNNDDNPRLRDYRSKDEHRGDGGRRCSEDEERRRQTRSQSRRRSHNQPRGRSPHQRPLNFRPQTFHGVILGCKSPSRTNYGAQQIANTQTDGVSSPRLHTARRCSFDGSRSPYSPEPFDPALASASTFPAPELRPTVTSPSRQTHRAQSSERLPLDDRLRSSKSEELAVNWKNFHGHRLPSPFGSPKKNRSHVENMRLSLRSASSDLPSIDMTQVPTGPAVDFFNGMMGSLQNRNNSQSADAVEHPRRPSLIESHGPQVITMETVRSSPPLPYEPLISSDQSWHSSTYVTQHSDVEPLHHDAAQRDYSHAPRPGPLSRSANSRSIDGKERRSSRPSSSSTRNKSQHHDNLRHRQEEQQSSHGGRGYRGSGGHHASHYAPHSHHAHYDNRWNDNDRRGPDGNHRHWHQNHRNGDSERHREYEVDIFRRSTDDRRGSTEGSLRRRSRMGRSSHNSVPVEHSYGQERSRRRLDTSRDRRNREVHPYHDLTLLDDKQQEEEVLESNLRSKWVDKREQIRE
ncbi:MAG: hypothetical protein J3R72DRAFT_519507 [Linnemannia gamsii]|nr:MAG: hypothetical protein J3R72DRAFT_519507 [Linnemannia gamsii]